MCAECGEGVVSSTDKRPIIALVPPLLSFSLAPSVRIDGGMQSRMWEVQELSSNSCTGGRTCLRHLQTVILTVEQCGRDWDPWDLDVWLMAIE